MASNNYKTQILEVLNNSASGLTLKEISDEVDGHRNTISKYLYVLEAEGKVKKKEVGTANLYTTTRRNYLNKVIIADFVKAIFFGLKKELPNIEKALKKVGHHFLERFDFPISNSSIQIANKARNNRDPKLQMQIFTELYNSFDFLQDDVEISYLEIQERRVVYRFKNLDFLGNTDDYVYYFYIMCGIAEGLFLNYFGSEIECNISEINVSKSPEDSYLDIVMEFK